MRLGSCSESRALDGLRIANRTDERLTIYWVSEAPYEGEELQFDAIDAHTTRTIADDCASLEMIARAPDGTEVARRGPFDQCNLQTWVVREPATQWKPRRGPASLPADRTVSDAA
jgi:hypothetical protein